MRRRQKKNETEVNEEMEGKGEKMREEEDDEEENKSKKKKREQIGVRNSFALQFKKFKKVYPQADWLNPLPNKHDSKTFPPFSFDDL